MVEQFYVNSLFWKLLLYHLELYFTLVTASGVVPNLTNSAYDRKVVYF